MEEKDLQKILERYDLVYVEEMGIIWKTRLKAISKVMTLGLAVLAARTLSTFVFTRKYHDKGLTWLEALKEAIPNLTWEEWTALSGINILSSALAYIAWRYSNKCYIKCLRVSDIDPEKTMYKKRICECNCRLKAYEEVVREARSELSVCNKTKKPDKCASRLKSFIIKYQGKIKEEKNKIETYKKIYVGNLANK
jgi:hypothetical protein